MTDLDFFSQRIRVVSEKKMENLRRNHVARESRHALFEKTWSPLIDHMKHLAKAYLPLDKHLVIELNVDEHLTTSLSFALKEHTSISFSLDRLYFKNDFLNDPEWFTESFNHDSRYYGESPALALKNISRHPQSDSIVFLHPDHMQDAKDYLEIWLATQIAFKFDQDRIYPKSSLEIIMKRSGSGPENQ
jgi:hypothetical protein